MADTNLGFCADMLKGLLQLFMFFDNQLMDVTKVFYMYSTLLYSLIEYLDLEQLQDDHYQNCQLFVHEL